MNHTPLNQVLGEQLIDRLAADGIIAEHSHGSYTVLEHTP